MNSITPDIRWHQRLQNFRTAFEQLKLFMEKGLLNQLEEQGLIQCFEYNFELAWNVIKDFFENQGETKITGSKDAFRLAFNRGLISDGQLWMDMVESRKLTSHTYNVETANKVLLDIRSRYYPAFRELLKDLSEKQQ